MVSCFRSVKWTPLTNLYCSVRKQPELNSNVNFVTGANGSGKSSVLQGLVLGLLADSKSTKRYSKMSEFIQKGYSKAIIQVTMSD